MGLSTPLTNIIEAVPGVYLTETRRKRARAAAGATSGQLTAALHSGLRQGDATRPVHPQTAPVSNRSQDTGQAAAVTERAPRGPVSSAESQAPGKWNCSGSRESWVRTADPAAPASQVTFVTEGMAKVHDTAGKTASFHLETLPLLYQPSVRPALLVQPSKGSQQVLP